MPEGEGWDNARVCETVSLTGGAAFSFVVTCPQNRKSSRAASALSNPRHCRLVILDGYLVQAMIVNNLSVYSATALHVLEGY